MIRPVIRFLSLRYIAETARCANGGAAMTPPPGCATILLNLVAVVWMSSKHRLHL
jgi:hypothetical protein